HVLARGELASPRRQAQRAPRDAHRRAWWLARHEQLLHARLREPLFEARDALAQLVAPRGIGLGVLPQVAAIGSERAPRVAHFLVGEPDVVDQLGAWHELGSTAKVADRVGIASRREGLGAEGIELLGALGV